MKVTLAVVLVLVFGIASAMPASAELYIAGELGYTMPRDFTDVKLNGAGTGVSSTDLKLGDGVMYGAKVGYYLPAALNWLGFETELYNANVHTKQQTVTVTGPGGTLTGTMPGSSLRGTVVALNLMIRYPGSFLQPYVGAGPAVFFTRDKSAVASARDTSLGLNVLAGVRAMMTKNFGIFAEYKYNRTSVSYDNVVDPTAPGIGLEGDYSSNTVAVGVSFHF